MEERLRNIVLFFIMLFFTNVSYSQTPPPVGVKEMIQEGESYFLFEEYKEALPLFLKAQALWPENKNLYYKIGVCYLNIEFKKEESIDYLEKAVKYVSKEYIQDSWKEINTPLESWYQLGHAYRVNNRLMDAIEAYKTFLELINDEEYKMEMVRDQITACVNAKIMQSNPMLFEPNNLGEKINTKNSENRPVVSGDENTLIFISELKFYDALFYSKKVDGQWSYPVNMMPELKVDGDVYPTSISYDGTELYIYRNDFYDGNIYVTNLIDGKWTKLRKLNSNINTKFWETHASISKDGNTLYFTSNRKGGLGGLDIYRSNRNKKGEWGNAVNLGPMVNTKYNEETPFISEDGKVLFFSSYGHQNMGGYDIFYSTLDGKNNSWNEPVNIGSPINTPDNDLFFQPVKNGFFAYYSMRGQDSTSFGGTDIYRFEVYSKLHPRMFKIEGSISVPDSLKDNEIKAYIVNPRTKEAPKDIKVDKEGKYQIEVEHGHYDIVVEGESYVKSSKKVVIKRYQEESTKDMPFSLQTDTSYRKKDTSLEPVFERNIIIEDSVLYTNADETLFIKLKFKKLGRLKVETIVNNNIVNTKNIEIDKLKYTFEFLPVSEKAYLQMTHTSQEGAISKAMIEVNSSVYNSYK